MDPQPNTPDHAPAPPARGELFSTPSGTQGTGTSMLPWGLAAAAVVLLVALAFMVGHRGRGNTGSVPNDAYAPNLAFSGLQMSESTSLSGGKSTFIDGTVRNNGPATVTSVQLEAAFANDEAMPTQRLPTPLTVIRSREPYVDTQALSAAPLAPGAQRDFRLIFENIATNWNQTLPQLSVVHVSTARNPHR